MWESVYTHTLIYTNYLNAPKYLDFYEQIKLTKPFSQITTQYSEPFPVFLSVPKGETLFCSWYSSRLPLNSCPSSAAASAFCSFLSCLVSSLNTALLLLLPWCKLLNDVIMESLKKGLRKKEDKQTKPLTPVNSLLLNWL